MHPIGIVTIVVAVAIVAGVIVASIVRKAKGKPSLGSDCAGCSHARNSSKSVRRNSKPSAKKPRNRTMIHNPPTTISSTSH